MTNVEDLPPRDRELIAHAAQRGNTKAVRLMIDLGFDPHIKAGWWTTPILMAALMGHAETVKLFLEHNVDCHGILNDTCWHVECGYVNPEGDYPATIEALIAAGASGKVGPTGDKAVDAILRQHGLLK